jgi:hypothetical protein
MRDRIDFETAREIALIGLRLLDDAHAAWVVAQGEAERALRAWSSREDSRAGYAAYRAAVDREEAAARDLERLHELTRVCTEALIVAG